MSSIPSMPAWSNTSKQSNTVASQVTTSQNSPQTSNISNEDANSNGLLWSSKMKQAHEEQMAKLVVRTQGDLPGARKLPLGEQAQNTSPTAITTSTVGLASPFIPSTDHVWGPPTRTSTEKPSSDLKRLVAMEAQIRDLTMENARLRESNQQITYSPVSTTLASPPFFTPVMSSSSSMFFDQLGPGMNTPGYGGFPHGETCFGDEEIAFQPRSASLYGGSDSDKGTYSAPHYLRLSVLSGTFNLVDIPVDCIRPIVWIIAHHQPRNGLGSNSESAGLKAAVNALATRLGYPRSVDGVSILIDSIIEWAKPLCFTACGNYLCQQLLERGDLEDKIQFIEQIKDDIVNIASDKFGTHVLCKAVSVKELETPIADALLAQGIFDSLRTGARRLWREYLERRRQAREFDIFLRINLELEGKWADLACANEHGSIAVQQVFEVFGSVELMEPCAQEILGDISRIGNNQFGHFVISKLMSLPQFYRGTCDAILTAYPPVATTHHGVNFAKTAMQDGGRVAIMKYVDALCSAEDGRTPGIVAVATSSMGKGHLSFLMGCVTPAEHARVRHTCRSYSTTLRNSQSGNDLLRNIGLIHASGGRHRGPSHQ